MATGSAAPRARGQRIEEAGEYYLQQRGLLPIERNFSCRSGEIDLVMREGDTLVFVEVRYRKTDRFGSPVESVTPAKQQKLLRAAQLYLMARPVWRNKACRFDILAARPGESGLQFEWVQNAFGA